MSAASHAAAQELDDLYRKHGPSIFRYALAVLGNHADAEDVTQTTFLNAYRSLEQGVRPRKPLNWLLTIASNAIKQRFRQEKSRPRQVELAADMAGVAADEETPSVGELLTALAKIPTQQRQAIVLREFEGRSYVEIADILGITTSALETLLFRARRSLTEELEHNLTCTEAQLAVSRAADERLGRKERRRLREHLAECPDCAQFARLQQRQRRALRGLALVPIPLSLALFKSLEGSGTAAAATLPTLGTGAGVGTTIGGGAAAGTGSAAGAGAATGGGVLAGSIAIKAAAVVAAVGVAGGAAFGTDRVVAHRDRASTPAKASSETRGASGLAGAGQGAQKKGKALGRIGQQPGLARSASAPGRIKKASGIGRASSIAHVRSSVRAVGHSKTRSGATGHSASRRGPKPQDASKTKSSTTHAAGAEPTTTMHGKSGAAQQASAAKQVDTGASHSTSTATSSGKATHGKAPSP